MGESSINIWGTGGGKLLLLSVVCFRRAAGRSRERLDAAFDLSVAAQEVKALRIEAGSFRKGTLHWYWYFCMCCSCCCCTERVLPSSVMRCTYLNYLQQYGVPGRVGTQHS